MDVAGDDDDGGEVSLRQIAARASTLAERCAGHVVAPAPPAGPAGSDPAAAAAHRQRLARWQALPPGFAAALFPGFSPALLGAVEWPPGRPLPDWLESWRGLVRELAAGTAPEPAPAGEPAYAPLVRAATVQLRRRTGPRFRWLAPTALADVQRALSRRLRGAGQATLDLEATLRGSGGAPAPSPAGAAAAAALVQAGTAYPVLGRIWTALVADWVEATAEWLARLDADWPALRTRLPGAGAGAGAGPRSPRPRVGRWTADHADPHDGGRQAAVLHLVAGPGRAPEHAAGADRGGAAAPDAADEDDGSGRGFVGSLVYKPRDLAVDRRFFGLLGWMNARGFPRPFRLVEVWPRSGYGWMEYVRAAPPRSPAERAGYRYRFGALAALSVLLDGVDGHADNLVGAGDQPVMVDLETLVHDLAPGGSASDGSGEPDRPAVLRTGLFAAAGTGGQRPYGHSPDRARGAAPLTPPEIAGTVSGFCDTLIFLLADPARRARLRRWRELLGSSPRRRVVRPTVFYQELLERSLHPGYLADGADRGLELATLAWAGPGQPAATWVRELAALERLDVPRFAAPPASPVPRGWPGRWERWRAQVPVLARALRDGG